MVCDASGDVAVVRTPRGVYLPGGGIEAAESAEEAVYREVLEECGLVILPERVIGEAVEIVFSNDETSWFEKASVFFAATLAGGGLPAERDHVLVWLARDRAAELLSPASHRWAVQRLSEAEGEGGPPIHETGER